MDYTARLKRFSRCPSNSNHCILKLCNQQKQEEPYVCGTINYGYSRNPHNHSTQDRAWAGKQFCLINHFCCVQKQQFKPSDMRLLAQLNQTLFFSFYLVAYCREPAEAQQWRLVVCERCFAFLPPRSNRRKQGLEKLRPVGSAVCCF